MTNNEPLNSSIDSELKFIIDTIDNGTDVFKYLLVYNLITFNETIDEITDEDFIKLSIDKMEQMLDKFLEKYIMLCFIDKMSNCYNDTCTEYLCMLSRLNYTFNEDNTIFKYNNEGYTKFISNIMYFILTNPNNETIKNKALLGVSLEIADRTLNMMLEQQKRSSDGAEPYVSPMKRYYDYKHIKCECFGMLA